MKGIIYLFQVGFHHGKQVFDRPYIESLEERECEKLFSTYREHEGDEDGVYPVACYSLEDLEQLCNDEDINNYWLRLF